MGQFDSFKQKINILPLPTPFFPQKQNPEYYKGLYINNLTAFSGNNCGLGTFFNAEYTVATTFGSELTRLTKFINDNQFNNITFYDVKTLLSYSTTLVSNLQTIFKTIKTTCKVKDASGGLRPPNILIILGSDHLYNITLFDNSYSSNIDFLFKKFGNLIDGINLDSEYWNGNGGISDYLAWSNNETLQNTQSKIRSYSNSYGKIFEAYLGAIPNYSNTTIYTPEHQALEMIRGLDRILFAIYPSAAYPFNSDLSNFFDYAISQFFTIFGNINPPSNFNPNFNFITTFETTDFPANYFNNNTTDYVFKTFSNMFNNAKHSTSNNQWGHKLNFNLIGYQWFKYTDLYCAL